MSKFLDGIEKLDNINVFDNQDLIQTDSLEMVNFSRENISLFYKYTFFFYKI